MSQPQQAPSNGNGNVCALCLESAQSRGGGVPLISPGCCGKWFHGPCMQELVKKGNGECPCCRAKLPEQLLRRAANTTPASASAPTDPSSVHVRFAPDPVAQTPAVQTNVALPSPLPRQRQQRQQRAPSIGSRLGNMMTNLGFGGGRRSMRAQQHQQQQVYDPYDDFDSDGEYSSRGNLDDPVMKEDPAATTATKSSAAPAAVTESTSASASGGDAGRVCLEMSSIPEWSSIGSGRMQTLHAIASISIKENVQAANAPAPRQPMDLVCVLDNSGSMSGGKFTHLKHAIRFVQSQLTADDRLSLVVFNSYAKGVHGLYRMNDAQKAVSESMVNSLQVTGCTDIHAGMKMGHEILANRTTKNPISCMFLLTDGQDGGKLAEKKALAASMKTAGTGLFVFAFGADHDSAHLNAISSAAESSFVYVESTDEVVDAFGGALGSQQGLAAKNMRLTVSGVADGVLIDEVNAGDYPVTVAAGRRGATVTFSSLFVGERRDVIVRMIVPAVANAASNGAGNGAIAQYPLLELTASYETVGESSVVMHSTAEENARCVVARLAEAENPAATPAQRHVEVDAQIRRLAVTDLLKRALDMGDRNSIDEARKLLTDALADLTANSVAFKADHKVAAQLKGDLETAIAGMRDRDYYARAGGRSMMTEAYSSNVQQRCAYSKGATKSPYQCSSSSAMQSRGRSSKC